MLLNTDRFIIVNESNESSQNKNLSKLQVLLSTVIRFSPFSPKRLEVPVTTGWYCTTCCLADKASLTVVLMYGVSCKMILATRSELFRRGGGVGLGTGIGFDLAVRKFSCTSLVSVQPLVSSAVYLTMMRDPLGSTQLYCPVTDPPLRVSSWAMQVCSFSPETWYLYVY